MKKNYRHSPPKKTAPKPRKKRAGAHSEKMEKVEDLYSHPIFHTRYAGKLGKYIRPFDPVWPTDDLKS
ncbi:MAG TPA: hypothetical protein VG537_11390 [Candidatus Kapabacteria bacterium]|nr:hypothetical protein [Candidatus Kapabacteria bacterium]